MNDIPFVEDVVEINFSYTAYTFLTAQWLGNLHDETSKSTRRMFI